MAQVTRIQKLQKWMESQKISILLIQNPIDLLYLTGISVSVGKMAITQKEAALFVDLRYFAVAKDKFSSTLLPGEFQKWVCERSLQEQILFDSLVTTYAEYLEWKKQFPENELVPWVCPIKSLRLRKDLGEIAALKKAAKLTKAGFAHIQNYIKEGVLEEELALEFEWFCRKNGAEKLSFSPIIAFGKNSAYPHYRAGKEQLKADQNILCDLGAVVDGYAGDFTRVLFFGNAHPILESDYLLIQEAQKQALSLAYPGTKFGMLDARVREFLKEHKADHLFTHGLSHGIGLDTHEYPKLKEGGGDKDLVLEPGMVFAIEPGIYREGLGGVRYEDVVLITETGHETL